MYLRSLFNEVFDCRCMPIHYIPPLLNLSLSKRAALLRITGRSFSDENVAAATTGRYGLELPSTVNEGRTMKYYVERFSGNAHTVLSGRVGAFAFAASQNSDAGVGVTIHLYKPSPQGEDLFVTYPYPLTSNGDVDVQN